MDNEVERELHFNDIVAAGLDAGLKSRTIVEIIKLMRNELTAKRVHNYQEELNYKQLYRLFVVRRKIKLLRYLFSL